MSDGYRFVSLPPAVRQERRPQAVWHERHKDTFAGELRVTLRAAQAVHVGSGHKRMDDGKVLRAAVRVGGGPGIPGSSLKGVLRSRYEAITRSCVPLAPKPGGWTGIRSSTGVRKARLSRHADGAGYLDVRCSPPHRLCAACALFGCMSLRGRVAVHDFACARDVAFASEPIHEQFGPNLHHVGDARRVSRDGGGYGHGDGGGRARDGRHAGGAGRPGGRSGGGGDRGGDDYFEVTSLDGRKFAVGMEPPPEGDRPMQWIEVIPAGSVLTGRIGVFNLTRAELGGLVVSLGYVAPLAALKVGGGKNRGFGRLWLTRLDCVLHDHVGRAVDVDEACVAGWREALEASEDYWREGALALHAMHRGDC